MKASRSALWPWFRDAALVVRRMARAPLFAAVAVATLAVGLGLFAVVYTVVEKVLLEPLPYRSPDDLYFVWRDYGSIQDRRRGALTGADIVELKEAGGVIENVVALQAFLGGVFSWGAGEDPLEISVVVTSSELFELLGVEPALGRLFAHDDAGPDAPFTMVLTDELWNRLGADRDIVGKEVRLNGRPHTVIGVLPRDFHFVRHDADGPAQRPDAYANLRVNLTDASPNLSDYSALLRARPGTRPEAVAAAVAAVGRVVDAREFAGRGLTLYAIGLKDDLLARVRPALLAVGAAGVVLALMLTVNLASVLLARAAQREREFAVARALGGNDGAVARSTMLEGGLLGLAGGALGALGGVWGTQALVALAPLDLPRREAVALDWPSAAAVIGIGVALGLVAAVAPALFAARTPLSTLLANTGVRGGGGGGQQRMRRGMIVAQVAFSLLLLNSGALVARSFDRLLRTDVGFRPEGVFTMLVRTPPAFFPNSDVVAFQDRVAEALASVPGVTRVGAAGALPLGATAYARPTPIAMPSVPGNTGDAERDAVLTDVVLARAGYFEVMGMRLVAGRTFAESPGEALEAVVDTSFARRFFPDMNLLGAKVGDRTIVGVIEHPRLYDVHQDGRPQLYLQNTPESFQRALYYVLATTREPVTLLPEIRAAVRRIDARVAVGEPRTMERILADALRQQRTGTTLIGGFAFGALLLAVMGMFGVIAASVTRRHHELAVRLAVGADRRKLLRLVLREAAILVAGGVLIGVSAVHAARGLLRGAIVGFSPTDPFTLFAVASGLVLVTLATAGLAARRVLSIDPAELLRKD